MANGTPNVYGQNTGLLSYPQYGNPYSNVDASTPHDAFDPTNPDSLYWEGKDEEEMQLFEEKPWIPTQFEGSYTGEVTPGMERRSARDERAIERARQGKVILDPRYRKQLKDHYQQLGTYGGAGRPMLKDYKFGSGDWLRAMQEWRSTVLPNKTQADARASVGAIDPNVQPGTVHNPVADVYTNSNLPSNNGAPYSGQGVSTDPNVAPGSLPQEDQDYWANISKQAMNNQWSQNANASVK